MTAPAVLLVSNLIWETTLTLFSEYAAAAVEAGCFWYGHKADDFAVAGVVGIPRQHNYQQHFEIDADDLAALTEVACASGLVAVAQLHSHPGCDVKQSPWDEQRVISQNVSSLVLPYYGASPCALDTVGMHRFIHGEWKLLSVIEAEAALQVMPALVDMRKA
jgi:hypothetical protein